MIWFVISIKIYINIKFLFVMWITYFRSDGKNCVEYCRCDLVYFNVLHLGDTQLGCLMPESICLSWGNKNIRETSVY
jgi:hypothetical protein